MTTIYINSYKFSQLTDFIFSSGFATGQWASTSNFLQPHLMQQFSTQGHAHPMSITSQNFSSRPQTYPCHQCGKVYRWKQSLSLHQRLECGKEPQFQCPHCPHRSKQKGSLFKHISNKHPNSS